MSNSLWPHGLQHTRLLCLPVSPGVCSNSCPLTQWCYNPLPPLLLLPSVFPSIRVFSNELALHFMLQKYWSFSASISPFNEYSRLIYFRIDWLDLLAVQSLSRVRLFATPWTAARQASLSFTVCWSLLTLMSIESVMLSNHLILCCSFSFCPQSFSTSGSFPVSRLFVLGGPSIGASASASVLSGEYSGLISFRISDWGRDST